METSDFGRTVRRWRERVAPETVGLPVGRRRRAVGLRREELAGLAGVSADYLTRLEQGRATSPSVQVVDALARGLRLADVERDLLFELAGHAAPGPGTVHRHLTPSVQRLLDRLADTPVAVYDATWTLLVANPAYDALMGDTTGWQGIERNAVWRHLVGPGTRTVQTPGERSDLEAGLVADLRTSARRYPDDRAFARLVRELGALSPRFVELWATAEPDPTRSPSRRKTVDHPGVGMITLDCDTLVVAVEDLRLMVYSAEPGTDDADRLALATVLGTQTFVG